MTDVTCTAFGCIRPVDVKSQRLCKPHNLIRLRRGYALPSPPDAGEEWRVVPGFEGYYAASDWGRIWSVRDCRTLVQAQTPGGYLQVTLCMDKKRFPFGVHVVIARTFIGPLPPGHQVLHGDNIRCHNIPGNLRYGTQAENIRQSVEDGTHNGLMDNRVRTGTVVRKRRIAS